MCVLEGLDESTPGSQGRLGLSFRDAGDGLTSPYLDGELPHGIFRTLFCVLDAEPEGSVGFLLCGPVVDTFLGGRELGVRRGKCLSAGAGARTAERGVGSPPHFPPPLEGLRTAWVSTWGGLS